MYYKKIFFLFICLFILTKLIYATGTQEEIKELLPGPSFYSAHTASDYENIVKPVDIQPEQHIKIAVLGLENNPFWITVKEGVMKAAKELAVYNCTVDWIIPGDQHTSDVFSSGIESAITQEYDAIATIAGESGIAPFINKAVELGIPVATFNSETATENLRLFFVGANSYLQGRTAAITMIEALQGTGKVAVITGFFAVEAHEERRKGFMDYISIHAPEIEIVGEVENMDRAYVAYTQAQDFMNVNPDLAGIYITAGGPFGAAAAVEDAGQTDNIKIICYDFVGETIDFVAKGVIYATIGQDPFAQGHDPAIRLFNYLVGNIIPSAAMLYTRIDVVTKDNMADFGF